MLQLPQTTQIVIVLAGLIVLFVLSFFYSRYRMKNAFREVIKILRDHGALDMKNAKTQKELGLAPRPLLVKLASNKDYKPYALQTMIGAEIIQTSPDGRIFLSEASLSSSNLSKYIK
jgi:hypothetical protein